MPVDRSQDIPIIYSAPLLNWYDQNARILPWRSTPGGSPHDPYRVWLSEIMLQQTTVAAVRSYFLKFITNWPNIVALAAADAGDVMAAWAGLGYYARARNLLACARIITSDYAGVFPDTEAELRSLPGIGRYTAAAIAAIAFGQRSVVMDANVERVVARIFAVDEALPSAKSRLYALTDQITPDKRAGDFAQAMMDLGSSYCASGIPNCTPCPLQFGCQGYAKGAPETYPVKAPKAIKPTRHGMIFWIEQDGKVLLVRRPDKGLLGGMRAFPTGPWTDAPPGLSDAPCDGEWQVSDIRIQHVFTHFALELKIARLQIENNCIEKRIGEWWPIQQIDNAGLPTVFAKVARAILKERIYV